MWQEVISGLQDAGGGKLFYKEHDLCLICKEQGVVSEYISESSLSAFERAEHHTNDALRGKLYDLKGILYSGNLSIRDPLY